MKNKNILFLMLIGLILFSSCRNQNEPDSLYPSDGITFFYHSDWTKTHYPKKIEEFKANPLAMNDIVFLGNSITEQGGDWASRFQIPNIKNRGISGDVTEGVLNRLAEICHYQHQKVFILIGINDLFQGKTPEFVTENILKIVEILHEKSPNTKIFIQTILPTSEGNLKENIKTCNDALKTQAMSKTYDIIDLHSLFADESDLIKTEYTTDGVHLNEEGYLLWTSSLKDEMLKP